MFISSDPKGEIYKQLINLAFNICDEFVLVTYILPEYGELNQNGKSILENLKPSLKEIREQFYWPGTYCSNLAFVHYYNTDNNAREIIKSATNSLQSWLYPNLPEDLSFLKKGKPWLINTSHEGSSSIDTNNKNEIKQILDIKGISIKINGV